jgi:hypothetical protein
MAKRSKKMQKSETKLKDFVIVTYAQDVEQARDFETLLKNNGIPVSTREEDEEAEEHGFAIMVPEDLLDEAHIVVESQDVYDDVFELSMGDEDGYDCEDDYYDDNF